MVKTVNFVYFTIVKRNPTTPDEGQRCVLLQLSLLAVHVPAMLHELECPLPASV